MFSILHVFSGLLHVQSYCTSGSRPSLLGPFESILDGMEEPAAAGPAPDRGFLAPVPVAQILEKEESAQRHGKTENSGRGDQTDPQDLSR